MTSPPARVTVRCPRCSTEFETWFRASINLDIEPWSEDEIDEATTAVCPRCATVTDLDTLIIEDGVWMVTG